MMDEEILRIATWLQTHASEQHIEAQPHPELARRDHDWIYLPVRIRGSMDAFERAERLQALEDEWQEQNPNGDLHLLLIPASE